MTISTTPLVTVLMPVYNGEKYLKESIESILNQTFGDYEFLIINDGSTDNSKEIILSYEDPRIVYVENEENIQLRNTLNKGIDLAKSELIARMDCDDIAMKTRLELQYDYLTTHTNIDVLGSNMILFTNGYSEITNLSLENEKIQNDLLFFNPLNHPTVMFRKDVIIKNNHYYSTDNTVPEDYELWMRISSKSKFANLKNDLLYYRITKEQLSRKAPEYSVEALNNTRKMYLNEKFPNILNEEINTHNKLSAFNPNDEIDFDESEKWLNKLILLNKEFTNYPEKHFRKLISERWSIACLLRGKYLFWVYSLIKSLFRKNYFLIFYSLKFSIMSYFKYSSQKKIKLEE